MFNFSHHKLIWRPTTGLIGPESTEPELTGKLNLDWLRFVASTRFPVLGNEKNAGQPIKDRRKEFLIEKFGRTLPNAEILFASIGPFGIQEIPIVWNYAKVYKRNGALKTAALQKPAAQWNRRSRYVPIAEANGELVDFVEQIVELTNGRRVGVVEAWWENRRELEK